MNTNIMNIMNDIKYGYLDFNNQIHQGVDENFSKLYKLQSPHETLEHSIGVCWDQVELERYLFKEENRTFLNSIGYETESVELMLLSLRERMEEDSFPHEIGVFLGYDLSDIKSFIEGKECLYVGYWKVYSNVEEKMEIFDKYTRCKNAVMRMIDKGYPIENYMR